MYDCEYCSEPVFENWITYCIHVYENHKEQHFGDYINCKICDSDIKLEGIKTHFHRSHKDVYEEAKEALLNRFKENTSEIICEYCDERNSFEKEHYYHLHMTQCHKDIFKEKKRKRERAEAKSKNYYCGECVRGYKTEAKYEEHRKNEHYEDWYHEKCQEALEHEYVCKECEPWKGYDDKGNFNKHFGMAHYSTKVTKECTVCGDEFKAFESCSDMLRTCGSDFCTGAHQSDVMRTDHKTDRLYYGYRWRQIAEEVRKRDNYSCNHCGMTKEEHIEEYGCSLDVDHWVPIRYYKQLFEEYWKIANRKSNLETFCKACHKKAEAKKDYQY